MATQPKPRSQNGNSSVSLRRSARLQLKQCSTLIPLSPRPQTLLKLRSMNPETSRTRLPTSDPIEALVSRAQLQDYPPKSRKRGLDRSIENISEIPSKRARLTERNLKAYTKLKNMGRHEKTRGSSRSVPKSSRSESKSFQTDEITSSGKTVSTTDSSFPRLAFNNGVLDPVNSRPPENLDYLRKQLNRGRDTQSPTESEYNEFSYRVQTAPNEMSMLVATSTLLKGYKPGYHPVYNQSFADFPKNVGFNNRLSAAQPDMTEGLDLTQFGPFPVHDKLGGAAVPTLERYAPTLSHLAGEWKGPGKDMICAETQAAYDGACLVYGRNEACSYLGNPDPPGYASVSSFTTDGTILNTYAHYSSQSGGQVKYHQYPTSTSLLRSSYEDFKTARRRLRNEQDDAKENSEKLRDELNKKWSAGQGYIEVEGEGEDDDDDNYNNDSYLSPPKFHVIQAKTADANDCDGYDYNDEGDEQDEPASQLLSEHYASFARKDGDEDEDKGEDKGEDEDGEFVQIPTPDASTSTSRRRAISEKTVSKAPRRNTGTSNRRRRSKK